MYGVWVAEKEVVNLESNNVPEDVRLLEELKVEF
jgi:hypothetical protein